MNVHGTHRFNADRARVFAAICDPQVLLAVIPGCESVEQVTPDEYEGRMTVRLPGAVGRYRTNVRLVDVHAPERSGMEGSVEGALGLISGHAEFVLEPEDSGTRLDYEGQAYISGPLARLDSRFTEQFAEALIDHGLRALDSRLGEEGAA